MLLLLLMIIIIIILVVLIERVVIIVMVESRVRVDVRVVRKQLLRGHIRIELHIGEIRVVVVAARIGCARVVVDAQRVHHHMIRIVDNQSLMMTWRSVGVMLHQSRCIRSAAEMRLHFGFVVAD